MYERGTIQDLIKDFGHDDTLLALDMGKKAEAGRHLVYLVGICLLRNDGNRHRFSCHSASNAGWVLHAHSASDGNSNAHSNVHAHTYAGQSGH